MLILTFGIKLAYASRNANTQFRVCLFYVFYRRRHLGIDLLNFDFLFISSSLCLGKAIPRRFDHHRICGFVQLLHHPGLLLIGTERNHLVFSAVYSITTHQHHHNGAHLSAKDLLST
jgi:hypothetical protein